MIRFISIAGFALSVAVSAQAMTPAPIALAGEHDHGNRCCLRRGEDTGQWCVRGKNHGSADPTSRPQVRDWNDLLALMPSNFRKNFRSSRCRGIWPSDSC